MTIIATAMKHLMAAGLAGDDLLRAVAEIEAEVIAQPKHVDDQAERRRTADRERKRDERLRKSAESADSADTSPNESISNPPKPRSSNDDLSPLANRIVSTWNDTAAKAGAREARGFPADRRKLLKARLAEHGEAALFEAIANVAASEFHCGKGDRSWRANLGWVLKAENFQRMLELAPSPSAKPIRNYPPEYLAVTAALTAERDRTGMDTGEYMRRWRELRDQFGIDDGPKAQPPPDKRNGGPRPFGQILTNIVPQEMQQ